MSSKLVYRLLTFKSFLFKKCTDIAYVRYFTLHLGYILSWVYFLDDNQWKFLNDPIRRVSWPFFSYVEKILNFNIEPILPFINTIVWFGFFSSAVIAILSLLSHFKSRKFFIYLQASAFFCFVSLDYQFKLNQHLILIWFTISTLFFEKSDIVDNLLLVLIYFFAGLLKFDSEWLNGQALYRSIPFLKGEILLIAVRYVLILELLFSWLLLSKNKIARNFAVVQFLVFHFVSYFVVGFYYPALMIVFVSRTIFAHKFELKEIIFSRRLQCLIFVFVFLQVLPHVLSTDPTITGQARALSLHMLESRLDCEATISWNSGSTENTIKIPMSTSPRLRCDPIIFRSQILNFCKLGLIPKNYLAKGVLKTRRTSQQSFFDVVILYDPCTVLTLSQPSFIYNSWINDPSD